MADLWGLTAEQFLRRYWQKKPRLIKQAAPRFKNFIDRRRAMALAASSQVESRLVVRNGRRWQVAHGPFTTSDFKKLPKTNWTLLIQGVNLHMAEADRLLRQFSFIPYSRIDDVMVSYAVPGGGVGPHFDSYDVFLFQGMGRRRWQIDRGRDKKLMAHAPLKLIKNFAPDSEHVLTQGDMLYLPPGIAHNGVALDECVTYSIGFRAPTADELALHFLSYLQDNLKLAGKYRDRHLESQREPALIGASTLKEVHRLLSKIRWDGKVIEDFFGRYLTEPKPHVFFNPPRAPLTRERFQARCFKSGVSLDLRTQMLYRGDAVFINGERAPASDVCFQMANLRHLFPGTALNTKTSELLYSWYRAGYLNLNGPSAKDLEQRRRA